MKYLSICSGIEAASVAFGPLGWKPLAFSEIEAFPRAVLKHHYPDTPCHGDFTLLKDEPWIVDADLLCGGTPCQSFSVAGLRQSLADDRGNLTLQFVKLADAIDHLRHAAGREPAWILWENVPGVFSTADNAFGSFLGGLCGRDEPIPEPADGWPSAGVVDGPTRVAAWRVLDAQHFGLAQRRKRVFVLARGGAGRWAAADALLPIIEGSGWHPAPSRGTGKGTARATAHGAGVGVEGVDYENNPVWAGEPMGPLMKGSPTGGGRPLPVVAFAQNTRDEVRYQGDGDICGTLAAEPGMKQTTYVAFDPAQVTSVANRSNPQPGDPCHTLHQGEAPIVIGQVNMQGSKGMSVVDEGETSFTLNAMHGHDMHAVCVRMREGKEGGGKGPLVSEDKSLTLATANDQVLLHNSTACDTLQKKGINHASTQEADTGKVLSDLRKAVGEEAFAQWGLGILDTLQQAEVLQSTLHGEGLRGTTEGKAEMVGSASQSAEYLSCGAVCEMRKAGRERRASQEWRLERSIADELGAYLSQLPQPGAQTTWLLCDLWKASEGIGLLRQALSTVQEVGRSISRKAKPASASFQVRRLTPVETERLQGFPDNYTNIPWRGKPESPDGPRYKALGNSWAVPCARWIGERIKGIRS